MSDNWFSKHVFKVSDALQGGESLKLYKKEKY